MTRRQQVRSLLAQTLREIGVLVLVCAPLEQTFSERSFDGRLVIAVMVVSLIVIGCGILVETRD